MEDDRGNEQADDRVGDPQAQRDDRCARENTQADKAIDARVVAIRHECRTVQPPSRPKPDLRRGSNCCTRIRDLLIARACSLFCAPSLDGAGEKPLHEVALEGEEDGERDHRETKVAGAMMSMLEPNVRSWEKIVTVIGCVERARVSATSRSFHVQRNWKIPSEAIAGRPSGRITRKKM